jgi:hypothetical protein
MDLSRCTTVRTIDTRSVNAVDGNDEAVSPLQRTESRVYRVVTDANRPHELD